MTICFYDTFDNPQGRHVTRGDCSHKMSSKMCFSKGHISGLGYGSTCCPFGAGVVALVLTANVLRELALSAFSRRSSIAMAAEKTFPKPLPSESLSVQSRKLDYPDLSDVARGAYCSGTKSTNIEGSVAARGRLLLHF